MRSPPLSASTVTSTRARIGPSSGSRLCRPTARLRWLPVTGPDSPSQTVHGIEALLSLGEVAQVLRISESGVYRLVRSGELPRVKVGNRTLFEPDDVRMFIATRREASSDDRGQETTSVPLEVVDG